MSDNSASPETTDFGFRQVPLAEKKPMVRAVFESVAPRYDLMNDLMSLGIHRVWKRIFVTELDPRPNRTLLDLAGGTGDISFGWLARGGGPAMLTDINPAMLSVGRDRALQRGFAGNLTMLAADEVRRFGIEPKVGLLSHSNFGSRPSPTSEKMRAALELLRDRAPHLEAEGEMHADTALSDEIRNRLFPDSRLKGAANLLIMPGLDAANIALNLIKMLGDGLSVGPILMGMAQPAHIITPSVTVRGIVNMTSLAVVDAQMAAARQPR